MNIIQTTQAITAFFLGSAIASFLSVVIYRIHSHKKGILFGRSSCPNCKKTLKAQHLIPVFSWIFLGGKCAYCKKKISYHYPLMELLTGLIYTFSLIKWPINESSALLFFNIIIFTFIIAIIFFDILYTEIPDQFSLPAITIAIIGNLILNKQISISSMLIGALIVGGFFLIQFTLSKGKWVGGGDIRMGALMGAFLGWKMGLMALVISYLIGGVFSIFLLMKRKAHRKTELAFGPFLGIATIIIAFKGPEILEWYMNFLLV